MFDEALERYNYKQTRADRKIENYYEKIRNSKQEKPFHELILQIGDKENMSAESENGELARQILDEYYSGFQERNPNLKVFSAHLHMDEATPHLHIDFVPFTTGSKRGLDTRVSLKQALDKQAEEMLFRLVNQIAEREGVTEQLKADNQMEWVARMNNIRSRATEVVNTDLIYT